MPAKALSYSSHEKREPRTWDAANLLTASRLLLAGWVWRYRSKTAPTLGILALAGLTDILDGRLARRTPDHDEALGSWLDPLCDKVFLLSTLAATFSVQREPGEWADERELRRMPLLIAARELVQLPVLAAYLITRVTRVSRVHRARERELSLDFHAAPAGKLATVSQLAATAAVVARSRLAPPLAGVAGAMGLIAAGYYGLRALREPRPPARRARPRHASRVHARDPSLLRPNRRWTSPSRRV